MPTSDDMLQNTSRTVGLVGPCWAGQTCTSKQESDQRLHKRDWASPKAQVTPRVPSPTPDHPGVSTLGQASTAFHCTHCTPCSRCQDAPDCSARTLSRAASLYPKHSKLKHAVQACCHAVLRRRLGARTYPWLPDGLNQHNGE